MSNAHAWWAANLESYHERGRQDAEKGTFDQPHYVTDEDPQNLDENHAYKEGFMSRRKEIGDAFKWK